MVKCNGKGPPLAQLTVSFLCGNYHYSVPLTMVVLALAGGVLILCLMRMQGTVVALELLPGIVLYDRDLTYIYNL